MSKLALVMSILVVPYGSWAQAPSALDAYRTYIENLQNERTKPPTRLVPEAELYKDTRTFDVPNGTQILWLKFADKDGVEIRDSRDGRTRVFVTGASSTAQENIGPLLSALQASHQEPQMSIQHTLFRHFCTITNFNGARSVRGECLIKTVVELPPGSPTIVRAKNARVNHLDQPVTKVEFLATLTTLQSQERLGFIDEFLKQNPAVSFTGSDVPLILKTFSRLNQTDASKLLMTRVKALKAEDVGSILQSVRSFDRLEIFLDLLPKTIRDERSQLRTIVETYLDQWDREIAISALADLHWK